MAYFILEIICVFLGGVILLFLYLKQSRQYWKKKNIPTIASNSIWGNIDNPLTSKKGIYNNIKDLYDEFKRRGDKHGGLYVFTELTYMPIDPDLIKFILTRDFQYFAGRGNNINLEKEPLTANIFTLDGQEWKSLRIKCNRHFTPLKTKMIFPTLLECAVPMIQKIDELSKSEGSIELKDILCRFVIDVIASCAFGVENNSFEDPNSKFLQYGLEIAHPPFAQKLAILTTFFIPSIRNWVYLRLTSKNIEIFFTNVIKNIIEYRKANNFIRNDFIQMLLEANEKSEANGEKPMTVIEMTAQCFLFFVAGFDTSSSTIAFAIHELAYNQEIQEKLRNEIKETLKKCDGKLTYDALMEMKYMDKVLNETLRKYPTFGIIARECTKNYKIPNTDTIIEKGTKVFISALGLHRDEEYYPNPNKFDPERFSEENKAQRHSFTYLPFGEGPRICIGMRFGIVQSKTSLFMLLRNYRFLPVEGEPYDIEFEPKTFILSKKGGVLIRTVKISS